MTPRQEIEEIVNRETRAWNTRDANLLITVFHPDMVWPWPPTSHSHDPMLWEMPWGRFNHDRWRRGWQEIFDTHTLVHNIRVIRRIEISEQADGAFAVVDVDTLWRSRDGKDSNWKGRACKVYAKINGEWKMTMHTGLLEY